MPLSLRSSLGLLALCTSLGSALAATPGPRDFHDLHVEVVGQGRPVLMIPGLNSGAEVWRETCAALQPQVQCHIVQLPGFAGARPVAGASFLEPMRDRLLDYVGAEKLQAPVLMGHSLGGTLALMMAARSPQLADRLVIVDSLPFLAGLRMPNATPEALGAMAAGIKAQMLAGTPEAWEAQTRSSAPGMTRDAERAQTVIRWGLASDRNTTASAFSELWGSDLRPLLPAIQRPTLVLGSWAAYAPMGATQASTRAIFEGQYAPLKGVQIRMSEAGFHFLMWDDAPWLVDEVKRFLAQ